LARPPRTLLLPRAEIEGLMRLDTSFGPVLLSGCRRPGAQRASEDSLLVHYDEDELVLVVADGAGGHMLGGEASQAAVEAVAATLDDVELEGSVEDKMRSIRKAAVEAVAALGQEAITTLAIAWIRGNQLVTCHAGDSTILLMGQRGRRKLRTMDHTPPGLEVAAGRLTLDQARSHPERHLLVNALGSKEVGWEITGPIEIGKRDTLVLATDGLFDNLSDDEIVRYLRKGSFEDGMQDMLARNDVRMDEDDGPWSGKPDDVAVLAWRPR